jgi:hypothetical protein
MHWLLLLRFLRGGRHSVVSWVVRRNHPAVGQDLTSGKETKQCPDGTVAVDGLNLNVPDRKLTRLVVTRAGEPARPRRRRKVMSLIDEALSANATIADGYDASRGGRRRPRSRSSPVRIPG